MPIAEGISSLRTIHFIRRAYSDLLKRARRALRFYGGFRGALLDGQLPPASDRASRGIVEAITREREQEKRDIWKLSTPRARLRSHPRLSRVSLARYTST